MSTGQSTRQNEAQIHIEVEAEEARNKLAKNYKARNEGALQKDYKVKSPN